MKMIKRTRWLAAFFGMICVVTSLARAEGVDEAVKTVKAYRAALVAGKLEEAMQHIAKFPGVQKEEAEEDSRRLIQLTKDEGLKLWIFPQGSITAGKYAVVTIGDGEAPAPDDPLYLILQDKKWKLLPGLTSWKYETYGLTPEEKTAFAALEEFHDKARKQLRNEDDRIVE